MRPRARAVFRAAVAVALLLRGPSFAFAAEALNGFSLDKLAVTRDLLRPGGPKRDEIRSVDAPRFVAASAATFSPPDATVVGLAVGGEARAYPVHLVERHMIVNDAFGDAPIAVVYDPLAGAPGAFRRRVGGKTLTFGVAGLVYNGGFVMYDRETESLWSPLLGQAIAGPLSGTKLERLRVRQETTAQWLARAPASTLLAPPDLEHVDYRYSPYSSYWVQDEVPFPIAARDPRFHAKELVLGVVVKGKARAYLGSQLKRAGGRARDELGGATLRVAYDTERGAMQWDVPDGAEVQEAYWFAWKALHPDTEVWEPPK